LLKVTKYESILLLLSKLFSRLAAIPAPPVGEVDK